MIRTAMGAALVMAVAAGAVRADGRATRWFSDRPVAWDEHDDGDVPAPPEANHIQELNTTLDLRDSLQNEADRVLALEGRQPARDVNALDEVPCSTWFCARNHLRPLSPAEVAAGAPTVAPRLPLKVVKGKEGGATEGFQVVDAAGRKFMLKFTMPGRIGLNAGSEVIGEQVFHAAGYNVPGVTLLDLAEGDLRLDPRATFKLYNVEKRPLTEARFRTQLAHVNRLPDGRIRAAAIPWIGGQILGSFDMLGVRPRDPNDRIPHEHRRSLRASLILFEWLAVLDPSAINTIDSYVADGGRHFVRHYFIDFGDALGSAVSPHQDGEYAIEVGRTLRALVSLGFYRRPFQDQRTEWRQALADHSSLGYFPAEDFDPDTFRTNRKVPAHVRMTDRDAYWGAKLVASFSDAQIAAMVPAAGLPEADARYLERALRVRRDILVRRYLLPMAAVENPALTEDGARVCFEDLAIARGYAASEGVRYAVEVGDGHGNRIFAADEGADGARTCVPIGGVGRGTGYRVVAIRSRIDARARPGKAARIHLRWRENERRFAVVGLERDE